MNRQFRFLLLIMLFSSFTTKNFSQTFFNQGDTLIEISGGGGNSHYNVGHHGGILGLGIEGILGAWRITDDLSLSLGGAVKGSFFFHENLFKGGFSALPTFHVSFYGDVDWFVGVGFGISLQENLVLYGAGFSTGFNIRFLEWFFLSLNLDIQGPIVYGSIGFKFLFNPNET